LKFQLDGKNYQSSESFSESVSGIPWVVLGEFWHEAVRAGHEKNSVNGFLDLGIPLLDAGEVIPSYAEICTELQESGLPAYRAIGQNDLWIAAVAVHWNLPLVSRNRRHFEKIAGLQVIVPPGGMRESDEDARDCHSSPPC
jgi:predicted nucleic acid-binding protein